MTPPLNADDQVVGIMPHRATMTDPWLLIGSVVILRPMAQEDSLEAQ